jgi:hypothetical protein
MATCILSPTCGGMLAISALLLIANAATALYMPAYASYVAGCITPPRNGTLLSKNLFSLSYTLT